MIVYRHPDVLKRALQREDELDCLECGDREGVVDIYSMDRGRCDAETAEGDTHHVDDVDRPVSALPIGCAQDVQPRERVARIVGPPELARFVVEAEDVVEVQLLQRGQHCECEEKVCDPLDPDVCHREDAEIAEECIRKTMETQVGLSRLGGPRSGRGGMRDCQGLYVR